MSPYESLKQFFKPTDATSRFLTDPFIVIDRERAIGNLKLDERAVRNGGQNFPPPDSNSLDDAELMIVAEIGGYANRAQIEAAANHRIYGERLSELALLRELSTISGASAQAQGDNRATVIKHEGRLSLVKDAIRESYQALADFKREHALTRPAHRGLSPVYAFPTIGISWLIESAFNTAFLRVNDE